MKDLVAFGALLALGAGGYALIGGNAGGAPVSEGYERSSYYAQCDTDYLQSAPYLGFRASSRECECFDDKLQQLSPTQQRAVYKSLEDRLTLAFMGKAGAQVDGNRVRYEDDAFGKVDARAKVETSGAAIMQQCGMF